MSPSVGGGSNHGQSRSLSGDPSGGGYSNFTGGESQSVPESARDCPTDPSIGRDSNHMRGNVERIPKNPKESQRILDDSSENQPPSDRETE